jgi:hypothetical protein
MLLRSGKYITNNIRRYTHTNNSQSSIKDPILDEKMNKIMSKLDEIDFFIKCTYFVLVVPPIISLFK